MPNENGGMAVTGRAEEGAPRPRGWGTRIRDRLADLAEILPFLPSAAPAEEPPMAIAPPGSAADQAGAVSGWLRGTGGMGVTPAEEQMLRNTGPAVTSGEVTKAQLMRDLGMGLMPREELPPDAGSDWSVLGMGGKALTPEEARRMRGR
jgi:hypothetical protein